MGPMITFKEFLYESAEVKALKHLYHPEELIFLEGKSGVKTALKFIRQTIGTLYKTGSSARFSRKWDGAPSTVFGHIDGKFFVGSKSVFNKDPKINFTKEDILVNHSSSAGLTKKLLVALEYLSKVTPKNGLIYQGDFLFDDEILTSKKIQGEDHHIFRPNTISYAVDKNSPIGRDISQAKMGIVVHTYYNSLSDSAQFLPDLKGFKQSKDVFIVDAEVELGDNIMLTPEEYRAMVKELSKVEANNLKLEFSGFYKNMDKGLGILITTYNNTLIRSNKRVTPAEAYNGLVKFIDERLQKEIGKLKSAAGQAKKLAEKESLMTSLKDSKNDLIMAYEMYNSIMSIKDQLVQKFNKIKKFGTFIENGETFVPTNDEGFVAIMDDGVVKLVDRFEFSINNFNLVKTW